MGENPKTVIYKGRKYVVRAVTAEHVVLVPRYRVHALAPIEEGVPYLAAGEIPPEGELVVPLAEMIPEITYEPPVRPNYLAEARARRGR